MSGFFFWRRGAGNRTSKQRPGQGQATKKRHLNWARASSLGFSGLGLRLQWLRVKALNFSV